MMKKFLNGHKLPFLTLRPERNPTNLCIGDMAHQEASGLYSTDDTGIKFLPYKAGWCQPNTEFFLYFPDCYLDWRFVVFSATAWEVPVAREWDVRFLVTQYRQDFVVIQ